MDEAWIQSYRRRQAASKRPPATDEERRLLAGWYGYRGRQEIDAICGISAYALRHFDLDARWRAFLSRHIGEEAGHGEHYIHVASQLYPGIDYWAESPEWEGRYGRWRRLIWPMAERGFLGFVFGLLIQVEAYGQLTAPIYTGLDLPEVIAWRLNEQLVDEEHHNVFFREQIQRYLTQQYGPNSEQLRQDLQAWDQEGMNYGWISSEAIHLELLAGRLEGSIEHYGVPLQRYRERIWQEWFGCEAPAVVVPAWIERALVAAGSSTP